MSRRPRQLPLESPNWIVLVDGHRRRWEQVGDPELAARDLTEIMAREVDGIRSMRRPKYRDKSEPDGELLSSSYWVEHEACWMRRESKEPIFAVCRRDRRHAVGPDGFLGPSFHYVYYCWKPDIEKIWPLSAAMQLPLAKTPETPVKRGRPTEYDWPRIAAEIALRVCRTMPTASDSKIVAAVAQWCEQEFGKEPATSELHKFVSVLRRHFPRQKK
jgi:hypothetical protein